MWERELMGLYISAHPLDHYSDYFSEQTVPFSSLQTEHDGKKVIVGGLIGTVRTIITKSGGIPPKLYITQQLMLLYNFTLISFAVVCLQAEIDLQQVLN